MWKIKVVFLLMGLSFKAISSSPAASPGSGVLQLSGTTDLDQLGKSLREGVSSLASFAATGLITAVLVTGLVYLAVGTTLATTRRRNGYDNKRKHGSTLSRRISRILSYISVNSIDDLVDTIKPLMYPTISRVGSGALESVGSVTNLVSDGVSGGIQTVSNGVSGGILSVSDGVSDGLLTMSETADTLSRVVSDKKLKDCILQAVCYLTPESSSDEGEGRKNQDKQDQREKDKKEKQQRKKNKKKKKKKQKEMEDNEENEKVTEVPEENESDYDIEIDSDDCKVFQCDIVKYGYTAYKLFDQLRQVKERLDNSGFD